MISPVSGHPTDQIAQTPSNSPSISRSQHLLDLSRLRVDQVKLAGVSSAAQPLSKHQELLKVFNIPYSYTVLSKNKVQANLNPQQAGQVLKTANTTVVGDMHGSYYKLVETLIAADLIEMSPSDARTFVFLAKSERNNSSDPEELALLCRDMKTIISGMKWKGGDRKLILMGDMLADRGPLDNITLDIVKHLSQQTPAENIVRIASNHDHTVLATLLKSRSYKMHSSCNRSISNALKFKESDPKLYQEFVQNALDYLQASKLMYLDKENKILYTHAPISTKELRDLNSLIKLICKSKNQEEPPSLSRIKDLNGVGDFADRANAMYQEYVETCAKVINAPNQAAIAEIKQRLFNVQTIYEQDCFRGESNEELRKVQGAKQGFLWARNELKEQSQLPFIQAGVETLVHGHDSQSAQQSPFSILNTAPNIVGSNAAHYTVINLDQNIRKDAEIKGSNPIFIIP